MQAEVLKRKTKALGMEGEALAARFLEKNGYKVLERNYRCRLGEVDLIVEKAKRGPANSLFGFKKERKISFVEVKTRRSVDGVALNEVISFSKQRHISRVAQHYVARHGLQDVDADFAVVLVDFSSGEPSIEFLRDAFPLAWGY